jgi:hypothetical protein
MLLAAIVGEAKGGKCFPAASPRLAADETAMRSTSAACSTRPEALDPRLNRGERESKAQQLQLLGC